MAVPFRAPAWLATDSTHATRFPVGEIATSLKLRTESIAVCANAIAAQENATFKQKQRASNRIRFVFIFSFTNSPVISYLPLYRAQHPVCTILSSLSC